MFYNSYVTFYKFKIPSLGTASFSVFFNLNHILPVKIYRYNAKYLHNIVQYKAGKKQPQGSFVF
jgi:hypothetical protein